MFQTPPNLDKPPSSSSSSWSSWSSHPSIDYSFKHSFAWPHGHASPGPTGGAAAGAAEAASHAQAHGHGMQYHYHGRGGYPFYPRHHRGGRRFIWFGLGVALTAWYFKHHEHKREAVRMVQASTAGKTGSAGTVGGGANEGRSGHFWRDGCDNSWGQGWKRTAAEYTGSNGSTGQHGANDTSVMGLSSDHADSAVLAALNTTHPPAPAQYVSPVKDEANKQQSTVNRGWGWHRRRHTPVDGVNARTPSVTPADRSSTAIEARPMSSSSSSSNGSNTLSTANETELKRLREVVEALWRDDKPLTPLTTKKDQADEQAREREQAREKLERLSTVLNALRESLKNDRELDRADRAESKKLV